MQIAVRAIPAPGHIYRRKIGRAFTAEPTTLRVVDAPSAPDEITATQYAALQGDPHIVAMPAGGGDPQVLDLRAKLELSEAALAEARRALADADERQDAERAAISGAAASAGEEIRRLTAENDQLRADLAKRRSRG